MADQPDNTGAQARAPSNVVPFPAPAVTPSVVAQRELERYASGCLVAIDRLEQIIAARPNCADDLGGLKLRRPCCEHGCDPCDLECATAPERLAWWEKELASIGGIPPWLRRRDGIEERSRRG